MALITERKVLLSTPWFELVAKTVGGSTSPYYSLDVPDFVAVVAVRTDGRVILVRQFRPAVEEVTLELPAGTVEAGESPEQAALRELQEETGHTAGRVEILERLRSDTGRLGNYHWCCLATDVVPLAGRKVEAGIEVVLSEPGKLEEVLTAGKLDHSAHVAACFLALRRLGRL